LLQQEEELKKSIASKGSFH